MGTIIELPNEVIYNAEIYYDKRPTVFGDAWEIILRNKNTKQTLGVVVDEDVHSGIYKVVENYAASSIVSFVWSIKDEYPELF